MNRLALLLIAAAADAATFGIEHSEKICRVMEPKFSPDGSRVAFVVARPNYPDNAWASELYLVGWKTRTTKQLTYGRGTVRAPRWSPSGEQLAFLATADGKSQIFVIDLAGGEARQITTAPTGVSQYEWRPDGAAFAFLSVDEAPKLEKFDDAFEVEAGDYLKQAPVEPSHIWTIPAGGGQASRLTSGKWSVSQLVWSPDGSEIAFRAQPSAGSRDMYRAYVSRIPAAGGTATPIADMAERHCRPVQYSPDGRWMLAACALEGLVKNQGELVLVPAKGGPWVYLSRSIDRDFGFGVWAGETIYASAVDGAGVGLWTLRASGAPLRWKTGRIDFGMFDVSRDGHIVAAAMLPNRPPELYSITSPEAEPERLTDLHAEIAKLELGHTEWLTWKSSDGLPLSAVVTFPPDFDSVRKYPLLVLIHGGPWGSSLDSFSSRTQLFAARGWIVFEPNYRGSNNAGNALLSAIYRDHGAGPGRDVMSGLAILKQRPYVDSARVGVSGWSYGGYMTTWLIGHYDGWKAALVGAPVIDLSDDYNLNDIELNHAAYGDTLSMPKDLELLREQSPITYVDRMHTPLLMISDTGDVRVPVTQSYKLLHALKERGQEAHLVLYPVAGHFPGDPVRSRDIERRWVEWFTDKFR